MQKSGKILRGRTDTLAPVVSTLRGRAPPSPHHSDAFPSVPYRDPNHRKLKCAEKNRRERSPGQK